MSFQTPNIYVYKILSVKNLNICMLQSKTNKKVLDRKFFTYKHDLSSWYSRITFYWLTGFLRNCYKHLIQLENLGQLPNREKSTTQYKRLYDIYLKQKVLWTLKTNEYFRNTRSNNSKIFTGNSRHVYQSFLVEMLLQSLLERVSVGWNIENDGRLCRLYWSTGSIDYCEFRGKKPERY